MKRHIKKYISLRHWLAFLRRQPKHMQHVHAFIFAGSITAMIAGIILYMDYGFWHEKYQRSDDLVTSAVITTPPVVPESPGEMLSRFWGEAHAQFSSIGSSGAAMLEGKEVYKSSP